MDLEEHVSNLFDDLGKHSESIYTLQLKIAEMQVNVGDSGSFTLNDDGTRNYL